jgi:predicted alpha/beta hydrolase family esterase
MKKLYLIHGWGGSPTSEGWFGWLAHECKKRKIQIEIPEMPDSENPTISRWVGHLNKVCKVDEETYFVGHSIGCQTIMRFLEKLPKERKVAGVGFVAGFFDLLETAWVAEDEAGIAEEKAIAKPWIETSINLDAVKGHTSNIIAIFSDDDPCVSVSNAKIFKDKLKAKTVIKHHEEHFNTTQEIPELLDLFK